MNKKKKALLGLVGIIVLFLIIWVDGIKTVIEYSDFFMVLGIPSIFAVLLEVLGEMQRSREDRNFETTKFVAALWVLVLYIRAHFQIYRFVFWLMCLFGVNTGLSREIGIGTNLLLFSLELTLLMAICTSSNKDQP